MRTYELMVVFAPDIAEDEMPGALERVSGYITTGGGEVSELTTTAPWGRRRLAYPIRDFRDGFYALYLCNLAPEVIGELERDLGLNNQVLRSLVTSYTPPKPKKPKKGDVTEGETADGETADGEAIAAPSGASMDTDTDLTTGPQGEDLTEPPTAETPAAEDERESEPARA
ncbi:MAG: 30S ribosomal protein S6 [Chloroflexota bacterium]|nr:30S ribosomal protein S6 [Chloroflexota bacterium]